MEKKRPFKQEKPPEEILANSSRSDANKKILVVFSTMVHGKERKEGSPKKSQALKLRQVAAACVMGGQGGEGFLVSTTHYPGIGGSRLAHGSPINSGEIWTSEWP